MEHTTGPGVAKPRETGAGVAPPEEIPRQRHLEPPGRDRRLLEERLRSVAAVDQAILEGGLGDDVLSLIAEHARNLVEAAGCVVLLPEDAGFLTVRAAEGTDSALYRDLHVPADATIAGAVMRSGRARNVADLAQDPRAHRHLTKVGRLGPGLFVPLTVRAHVVGVLQAVNHQGARPFSDEDCAALRLFAAQIGLAVETHLSAGVALVDALSLRRRDERVRARLELLAPSPVEPGTILRQTLDRLARTVVELTEVPACCIQLLGPGLSLRTGGSFGLPRELMRATSSVLRDGVAQPLMEAVTYQTPVVVTNERDRLLSEPGLTAVHDLVAQLPWDAVGILPLTTGSGNLGAVCYFFSAEHRPDEGELRLIKAMAAQAATVVDNAQLLAAANKTVALEERQHLARELHDSVSQALYGIALGARATLEQLDHDPVRAREPVNYVLHLAETALAEMRSLIFELREESLRAEGLGPALTKQAEGMRTRTRISVDLDLADVPESDPRAQQALFRIGKEALHNVEKHAGAHHVDVRLGFDDVQVTLEVADDGKGFDPDAGFPGHLGLQSMRERAAAVGGTLQVCSRPASGTRVRATVPRFPDRERSGR